jgi:hypothetical protein
MTRRLVGAAWLVTSATMVSASEQRPEKVIVTGRASVYVTPRARPEPLTQIEAGVVLSVLGTEGDWYLIEYLSPRWGERRGYIHRSDVQPVMRKPAPGSSSAPSNRLSPSWPPRIAVPAAAPDNPTVTVPDKALLDRRWVAHASALAAIAGLSPAPSSGTKIMVFAGKGHRRYLGCLSCPPSAPDSIFNPVGKFGHCGPFADDSLFCRGPFKGFGSSGPFDDLSGCASGASDPPVIVDEHGTYYGRFSIGGTFGHNDSVCGAFGRFRNPQACDTVAWVCGQ